MCDTLCALPASTATHRMLFGKNSDRQRNEAQGLEFHPGAQHAAAARVACTYIAIPQIRRTNAVLISRPYWIWGAEMGANEHGVVIGNETVYSKSPAPEDPALIGMDLVRLGLERATTAAEAVETMTRLLEQHGQGGDCGHLVPFYYNNGFMIADRVDAFVLETVGREWLVERVRDVRSISNCYSISSAAAIADRGREGRGTGRERLARSTMLLRSHAGHLGVSDLMGMLRDHGSPMHWSPSAAHVDGLCMHAGSKVEGSQTTASMISELGADHAIHWVTGTAAPCISIFKPILMDAPLPPRGLAPGPQHDSRALWWRHERLHRMALAGDFPRFIEAIQQQRDELEAEFRNRVEAVCQGGSSEDRANVISRCWREADEAEDRWLARISKEAEIGDVRYRAAWMKLSRIAGMDI